VVSQETSAMADNCRSGWFSMSLNVTNMGPACDK